MTRGGVRAGASLSAQMCQGFDRRMNNSKQLSLVRSALVDGLSWCGRLSLAEPSVGQVALALRSPELRLAALRAAPEQGGGGVLVKGNGEDIPVSSVILAAKSEVLRTMLSSGMKESDKREPILLKVTARGEAGCQSVVRTSIKSLAKP